MVQTSLLVGKADSSEEVSECGMAGVPLGQDGRGRDAPVKPPGLVTCRAESTSTRVIVTGPHDNDSRSDTRSRTWSFSSAKSATSRCGRRSVGFQPRQYVSCGRVTVGAVCPALSGDHAHPARRRGVAARPVGQRRVQSTPRRWCT